MKIMIFLIISMLLISCSQSGNEINNELYNDTSSYNNEDDVDPLSLSNDYSFQEGYINTNDNSNLYYRLYHKKNNEGLIVLSHKEDSSLEEWDILMDIFLELNYNIVSYDLRGFGKSQASSYSTIAKMKDDLKLIVNFAQNSNESKFKNIVFIGDGLGANISLYSSVNYCQVNSSFIMISPKMFSDEMSVDEFNKYCDNSKYLFLYSKKDFKDLNEQLYIYNYDNLKTMIDSTSDYTGIDILLNNSTFIKEIKNIINF